MSLNAVGEKHPHYSCSSVPAAAVQDFGVTGLLFSISCRLRPTCRAHAHACRSLQLSSRKQSPRLGCQVVNMR